MRVRVVYLLALLACLVTTGSAWSAQCSNPTLKGASGVISNEHDYKIEGGCTYQWSETEKSATSSTTTNYTLFFSYLGGASWNRLTGEAEEQLKFTGDAAGTRVATAKCSQDPFLKDPPGGPANCGPIKVQVEVDSGNIYKLLLSNVFWAAGKIALVEAQALSALPPPSQPTPEANQPTPVATASSSSTPASVAGGPVAAAVPATGSRTASAETRRTAPAAGTQRAVAAVPTLLDVEAETLVAAGAAQASGGQAAVQPMASFGTGWSGGSQLFWAGGAVGAVLDLTLDIPAASKYAVEIYMTRAPDYGRLQFEIDGKASSVPFDGMAPQVLPSGPIQLGTYPLQAGQRRVSLMIVGKHAQSTGFYVGVDKVRLYPAGPIE